VFADSISHYGILHQLILESSYFPTMAHRGARGRIHATIGDVYECDEAAHEE
jgi:hypothetical protein